MRNNSVFMYKYYVGHFDLLFNAPPSLAYILEAVWSISIKLRILVQNKSVYKYEYYFGHSNLLFILKILLLCPGEWSQAPWASRKLSWTLGSRRAYVVAHCPLSCFRPASVRLFFLLLPNHWSDWAEIWCGASGQLVDLKLYKSGRCPFLGPLKGVFCENIKKIFFSEPLVRLIWNLVWALGQLVDLKLYKSCRFDIQYGGHGCHLENLFSTSSPEPLIILS